MDFFMCFITIKTNKMSHKFSCNEKCLIYLLTWQKCEKQYLGKKSTIFACDAIITETILENFLQMKVTYNSTYMNIPFVDR